MEVLNQTLQEVIDESVEKFLSMIDGNSTKTIRIISHIDTDGITSAAILAKVLKRLNLQYWLTNIKSFDAAAVENLEKEEWDIAFILDFGLNEEKLKRLDKLNKKIFILDHHILEFDGELNNINLISAYLAKEEISTSGIVYFFGKSLAEKNKDLAHIAIIGLVGDFQKINESILKDAIESKRVTVRKSLRVFGTSTKPLHRALAMSDIFIPGISGNEMEAIELIKQAGINLKENGRYRTLLDLSEEEMKKLCTLIAARSKNEDFIGYIHLINSNGKLYDSRELSTIINSCGRLGFVEAGIEACYDKLQGAEKIYRSYRKELSSALRWFEQNKTNGDGKFLEACNGKVWLINAGSEIRDTIIGVLISMLSRHYKDKVLIGMAEDGDRIKISARASTINVKEFLDKMLDGLALESGGHKQAAGGLLSKNDGEVFVERIKNLASW